MWYGTSRSRAATKKNMPPTVSLILHFRIAELLDHLRVRSSICHFLIHNLWLFSYGRLAVYEKGAKRNQRKPKRNPKGAKRDPKKAKWSQRGAKREPEDDQTASQSPLMNDFEKYHQQFIKMIILETILHQKPMQKAMQKSKPNKSGQMMKHFENRCNNCWIYLYCF